MTTLTELQQYFDVAPQSGTTTIDALLNYGNGWLFLTPSVDNTLYYSFSVTEGTESGAGPLTAFNDNQKTAARAIMSYAAGITGIQFVETSSGTGADLHFAAQNIADAEASGICDVESHYSYQSTGTITSFQHEAYVYLDNAEYLTSNQNPAVGSEGYQVLLHEVGHALGLKHPFESSSAAPTLLDTALDNTNNTIMSYTWAGDNKTVFQSYDLAALDFIYGGDGLGGTNFSLTTGGDTGGSDTGGDTGGNTSTAITLNGSSGNDKLTGSSGDDRLVGGAGVDKLTGGAGADVFVFDNLASGGADKILDFKLSEGDTLVFDATVFTALAGGIDADNLRVATKAKALDGDDYLLFATKGKLYYDADGSGADKAILLAGIKGSFSGIDATSFAIE